MSEEVAKELKSMLAQAEEEAKAAGLDAKGVAGAQKDKLEALVAAFAASEKLGPAADEFKSALAAALTPHFASVFAAREANEDAKKALGREGGAKDEALRADEEELKGKYAAERAALIEAHERALEALEERYKGLDDARTESKEASFASFRAREEALDAEAEALQKSLRPLQDDDAVPDSFASVLPAIDRMLALKVVIDKGFGNRSRALLPDAAQTVVKGAFNTMYQKVDDGSEAALKGGIEEAQDEALRRTGVDDYLERTPPAEMVKEMVAASKAAIEEITKKMAAL